MGAARAAVPDARLSSTPISGAAEQPAISSRPVQKKILLVNDTHGRSSR
jgi:hypothetical protein